MIADKVRIYQDIYHFASWQATARKQTLRINMLPSFECFRVEHSFVLRLFNMEHCEAIRHR